MKIVTWNVNSIRVRLDRVKAFLSLAEPDVLCLQEIKSTDDLFPREEIEGLGYSVETFGQKTYNGVAIISKEKPKNVERGFPKDPVSDQARVISADIGGVHIVNVYVVNGEAVGTEKFDIKLKWLDALHGWIKKSFDPKMPTIILGDFNIAPEDRDVYDPDAWRGRVLFSEPEHERLQKFLDWGFVDLLRIHTKEGNHYSWWDYRHGAFARNMGLRLDLILGTQPVAKRCIGVEIDRDERKAGQTKPSDHVPVIATLE